MKRVKHFLLASCLFPTLLGAQEMASAYFLELTPDAQSAGMAGTGLATTDNGTTAIFHDASTIAFSQEVMGASYSYAKINQDYALHSASLFYRKGRHTWICCRFPAFQRSQGARLPPSRMGLRSCLFQKCSQKSVSFINVQIPASQSRGKRRQQE